MASAPRCSTISVSHGPAWKPASIRTTARNASGSPEGLAFTPLAVEHGKRAGPREYLLRVQKQFPDNLTIQKHALVTRVLFEGTTRGGGGVHRQGARVSRRSGGARESRNARAQRGARQARSHPGRRRVQQPAASEALRRGPARGTGEVGHPGGGRCAGRRRESAGSLRGRRHLRVRARFRVACGRDVPPAADARRSGCLPARVGKGRHRHLCVQRRADRHHQAVEPGTAGSRPVYLRPAGLLPRLRAGVLGGIRVSSQPVHVGHPEGAHEQHRPRDAGVGEPWDTPEINSSISATAGGRAIPIWMRS